MPNVFEIIQHRRAQDRDRYDQVLTQGVVTGVQQGQYQVLVGGMPHLCQSGISDALTINTRVYVVIGRGQSKIIGLMAKDENAA